MWGRLQQTKEKPFLFPLKKLDKMGKIKIVKNASGIDQAAARTILIDSFITEYSQYLQPQDISNKVKLTCWRGAENSVEQYYTNYFAVEFDKFASGQFEFWVEAYLDDKLVGWATFEREKQNAVYMDLLIVMPEYQGMGIGKQLVQSLVNLGVMKDLQAVNVLLRKTNKAGAGFYECIGFVPNPEYKRANFVDVNLLTGITWHVKLALEDKQEEAASTSPTFSRKG